MGRSGTGRASVGSPRSPIDFGNGWLAYKRRGHWRCLRPGDDHHKFLEVTDHQLILELERRGYQTLHPAHECIDRPHLPCVACELAAKRTKPRAS